MAVRTEYQPGTPCWVDLSTTDFAGAQRFYSELFGWQLEVGTEESGSFALCFRDHQCVAGITPSGSGLPDGWTTYLASDDVDETAQRVTELGGQVLAEPVDAIGGRMCVAADPAGAAFGVWEAGEFIGAGRIDEPGALCWAELLTPDGATADPFYRELFGYQQQQMGDGADFDYTVWNIQGKAVSGRLHAGAGTRPEWMAYFAVDDCDKAAAKAADMGAMIVREPTDSAYGRLAVLRDPWNASLSIMKLADPSA